MSEFPARPRIKCEKCGRSVPENIWNSGEFAPCPGCGSETQVFVFPALYREKTVEEAPERTVLDEEASCFHHPKNRATVVCEGCGRFICNLCSVEMGGRSLCPNCISSGMSKGTIRDVSKDVVRYDQIALAILGLSFLMCGYPLLITAPIAFGVCIYGYRRNHSLVANQRPTLVIVGVLSLLMSIASCVFWYLLFTKGLGFFD